MAARQRAQRLACANASLHALPNSARCGPRAQDCAMGYSTQLYSKGYKGYSSQGVLKGYPKVLKGFSRGALEAVRSSGGLPAVTFSILTAADRAGLCTLGQAARREIEPATRHAHPARDDIKWVQIRSGPQSKPLSALCR